VATPVTLAGSGFPLVPTVVAGGANVAVSAIVRVSATQITCTLTPTIGAALNKRTITVSSSGAHDAYDSDTLTQGFTVLPFAE
jgi:hypothetical protein